MLCLVPDHLVAEQSVNLEVGQPTACVPESLVEDRHQQGRLELNHSFQFIDCVVPNLPVQESVASDVSPVISEILIICQCHPVGKEPFAKDHISLCDCLPVDTVRGISKHSFADVWGACFG